METPRIAVTAKATVLATPEGVPPVVQAASVASALIKKTGLHTLSEVDEAVAAGDKAVLAKLTNLALTPYQASLIAEFSVPLGLLYQPGGKLFYCADCGAYSLVYSAPTRCYMTYGCDSKNVYSSKAATGMKKGVPVPDRECRPYDPGAEDEPETTVEDTDEPAGASDDGDPEDFAVAEASEPARADEYGDTDYDDGDEWFEVDDNGEVW